MRNYISEELIEKNALKLLKEEFGYRTLNCFVEKTDALESAADGSARANKTEVVFAETLRERAEKLNPQLPKKAVAEALEILTSRRAALTPLAANREVYDLIRDGIPVEYDDEAGRKQKGSVAVIDFDHPENNDFLAVTQLWIRGERLFRRPDLLIYVNGLPLVFFELKDANVAVKNAYDDNLTNYRSDIPLLFNYNAFCVLSNAAETKLGSFNAPWDFFFSWLRPDDEKEKIDRDKIAESGVSLERLLRGLCPKARLLDYIENFILFYGERAKIVAQNHQFLGVDSAIESFRERKEKKGRLGVFWHTQGSGKSYSMIFLSRKIFRKFPGNYTFVIVTDRDDLDGQIYGNFLETGAVSKTDAAQPKNSEQLRAFLKSNKRLIFTLIHKFRWDAGREYPLLSDRDDIIVIVDEAHRTQYASLAENMRKGLPNAQYYAFTGTPILGQGDRLYKGKTYDWFGDYVSQYNFIQSIDDGATVPLYYQKRLPEVLLQNETLDDDFYQILEDENLDPQAQEKLENQFAAELEVIKRDDRLDKIARDIAAHFPERGYLGKGMVVSVDKFTAVKMYDKVQAEWKKAKRNLVGLISKTENEIDKEVLKKKLEFMNSTEMAVVISEEAGEEEKFAAQKLDIKKHRDLMNRVDENGVDIETRFKKAEDPLRLVFVCAMWLTGFDAPAVSVLYLDKPMKGHTLMQTIARANRVCAWKINGVRKTNGEIVDYYNVFRDMKKALSHYGQGGEGGEEGAIPDKSKLFELLDQAIASGTAYCVSLGIDLREVVSRRETYGKIDLFKAYADRLLSKDEYWKEFKVYENTISSLYEACKPEINRDGHRPLVAIFAYLRGVIDSIIADKDVESARRRISELLDQSVIAEKDEPGPGDGPRYFDIKKGKLVDLSKLDFEKLKKEFPLKEYKNIEIANLREFLKKKLEEMMALNATRAGFAARLQAIIDVYNSGGMKTESYYEEFLRYAKDLGEEETRAAREGLTEDELELFDILKKDKMSADETVRVKNAAKHLLSRLRDGKPKVLVPSWFKDTRSKLSVKSAIDEVLDTDLPESYDRALFTERSRRLFELIEDYAVRGAKWTA
ncbi:MAG: type I restriction endonuclease subunit R [Treponemataceae bacterium]